MERYGTDRPDLRFGLPLVDLSDGRRRRADSRPFEKALAAGERSAACGCRAARRFSRKQLDELDERSQGARRRAASLWVKRAGGRVASPAKKRSAGGDARGDRSRAAGVEDGRPAADRRRHATRRVVRRAGGAALRGGARARSSIDESQYAFCWVTEFPLFELRRGGGAAGSPMHHPFTAPREEDLARLETDPGTRPRPRLRRRRQRHRSSAAASIRIHRADVQERVFRLLGISRGGGRETSSGSCSTPSRFGAPPHGGIALRPRSHLRDAAGGRHLASATSSRSRRPPRAWT